MDSDHENEVTHYPLPFYMEDRLLPHPLPTDEEIDASQDVLEENPGCRVVRVGIHFLVKYGEHVSLHEAENMLFVKESTDVPVPQVYAMYKVWVEGQYLPTRYIIMEHVLGECLNSCWKGLNHPVELGVAKQLWGYFNQLRRIPSPGFFGLLARRPFSDSVSNSWASGGDDSNLSGPFNTIQPMLRALARKCRSASKRGYYDRVLPRVMPNHGSVFTHGDFQRENVLVKPDGTLVLIGWEAAGWYPEFWEYAWALSTDAWDDDWYWYVCPVLDEYSNEYAWMKMVFEYIWG